MATIWRSLINRPTQGGRQDSLDWLQLLRRIKAEPECHLADVAGGLEHQYGTTVPKLVGRHGVPNQSGVSGGSGAGVLVENVFEPGPCHRGAFSVDEELWDKGGSAYRQPGSE